VFANSQLADPPTIKPATLPAPTGGINSLGSLATMKPTDSIYTVNIDATVYGCKVRPGYVEYANGFAGDDLKTIMPFSANDPVNDRIFGVTNDGIYDITVSTTTPVKVVDWPLKSSSAGWCSYTQFVNDAGAHVLLVCDLDNGFRAYTESTGLWSTPVLTGPTNIVVFVTVWKNRVWYIEKDTANAWYTDVGTFSGVLTKFNFGNKFRYGGQLIGLYDWTLDSGEGSDDYLVSVSGAGDVVVYSGTDPSSSNTFGQIGVWFIGALPAGRRVGSQFGGDLLLLSTYGLVSMQDLLKGANPFTIEGSLSYKIQDFLTIVMRETREMLGWEVKLHPNISRIIISTPKLPGEPFVQFVYDVDLQAWSIWEDMPLLTSESFEGESYFGSEDVRVWKIEGNMDNVTLADPMNDSELIYWRLLTAYSDLEAPETFKRCSFLRPVFISELTPTVDIRAFYDYDLSQLPDVTAGGIPPLWGTAIWDVDIWPIESPNRIKPPVGAAGMGKVVAVAMSGRSQAETTLIAIGMLYDSGGMM
jgi:hypothetical protein